MKQKITLALVLIVILVVIWQIYTMMGSGESGSVSPQSMTNQVLATAPPPKTVQSPINTAITTDDQTMLAAQQNLQKEYLEQINQLQMLKVQKDIADLTQAIAQAKLQTATAQNDVLKLSNSTAPSPDAFTKSLSNTPTTNTINDQKNNNSPNNNTYTVISVSKLNNHWTAVLGSRGTLYRVGVGDNLPDNSIIRDINDTGVTLEINGMTQKFTLNAII